MKILSSFTQVVPNLYEFLSSVQHKIIYAVDVPIDFSSVKNVFVVVFIDYIWDYNISVVENSKPNHKMWQALVT